MTSARCPTAGTRPSGGCSPTGFPSHRDPARPPRPDLTASSGPSWCHYQGGPWPGPHDAMVDFRSPVDGFRWLDKFGQRAADQVLNYREPEKVVVGHADCYARNIAVVDSHWREPSTGSSSPTPKSSSPASQHRAMPRARPAVAGYRPRKRSPPSYRTMRRSGQSRYPSVNDERPPLRLPGFSPLQRPLAGRFDRPWLV
jgi:hypothetical protein